MVPTKRFFQAASLSLILVLVLGTGAFGAVAPGSVVLSPNRSERR